MDIFVFCCHFRKGILFSDFLFSFPFDEAFLNRGGGVEEQLVKERICSQKEHVVVFKKIL